ncbi:unnamed protein product [Acanthoscelides obtectus]|uniref:C2H2-type domain-containing protein n=1 Tax=Acanthoscelides obtectus TaxID=200917 RepID=A0A9P0PEZ2_ACAOB|nr:unnamed protein product [Acanthoscelides obtectus]CAK1676173.1 Zinc finger protein 84 [Acanthoscelides obtectus]
MEFLSDLREPPGINMNPESDFEPDNKPSIKSEETYPDYVADYDSNLGEFQSVKDEHWDGVNQVKTENQLVVEVKSEKPDAEPYVDNMKFENVDVLTLNDDIKYEYDKDAISDLTCDRIKIEEKFLPGIEADWTAGTADQMEMGFQSFEKAEDGPRLNYENTDKLKLHQEFDIKTEGDQNDGHDSASHSAQIRKDFKMNHKFFIIHVKRKNSCLGSSLEKSQSVYECIHCEFKTNKKSNFVRHKANNHSEKPFGCINCDAAFKYKISLDNHVIRKHAESIASVSSEIHECGLCGYKTAVKGYLTKHMLIHNDNNVSDLHVCKHCNKSFKKKRSLMNHILKKHPNFSGTVSIKIYECMHCAFKQTNRGSFITHMATHNSLRPFACINCDSVFKSKVLLDNHVIRKHAESIASVSSEIYECRFCDYKAAVKRYLTTHLLRHNYKKFPDLHVCKNCNASFKAKQSLLDHILRKHPEFSGTLPNKIYECVHCEYKTTRRGVFIMHMVKHSGKPFRCINCDAAFKSKMLLDNHVIRKHAESIASVSSKIHECTYCDYKTVFKCDLAAHMLMHTKTKGSDLHVCKRCNMAFKAKRPYINHILKEHPHFSWTGFNQIYECIHCAYKTTRKSAFLRHMGKHDSQKL